MSSLAHAHDDHAPHGDHAHDAHGHHNLAENNFLGLPNLKLAMWAFLGSETFFFGSLIGTYFYYHGKSLKGPLPMDVFSLTITSISTFLLLMSSLTMALAVDATKQKNIKQAQMFLFVTAALGATFVGFQVYEFSHFYHAGLGLSTSLFASTFYVMTGFHGGHVTIGVIWILIQAILMGKGRLNAERLPLSVEVTGLYWHFVDIVWIVIFTFVYILEFIK